jgi:hypothetical protein
MNAKRVFQVTKGTDAQKPNVYQFWFDPTAGKRVHVPDHPDDYVKFNKKQFNSYREALGLLKSHHKVKSFVPTEGSNIVLHETFTLWIEL